jgi:formate-dependent nitrite reductase membrane component NrfD
MISWREAWRQTYNEEFLRISKTRSFTFPDWFFNSLATSRSRFVNGPIFCALYLPYLVLAAVIFFARVAVRWTTNVWRRSP